MSEPVRRTVPRGKALRRSEEEHDEATSAQALQVFEDEAREDWIENAPQKKTLLESKKAKS